MLIKGGAEVLKQSSADKAGTAFAFKMAQNQFCCIR